MRALHIVVAFVSAAVLVANAEQFSPVPVYFIAIVNSASLVLYVLDKVFSIQSVSRVPERWLVVIAALGGFVGASLAQGLFRHKTSKTSFQIRYWVAALIGWLLVFVITSLS